LNRAVAVRTRPGAGVVSLFVCALALWSLTPAARAAGGGVTASVNPTEVALTPGASAKGVLLLANGSDQRMTARVNAKEGDSSVHAEVSTKKRVIPSNGSIALVFTVTRTGEGIGQDTGVQFIVTSKGVKKGPPSDPQTVAALTVKAASSLALVEAKVESNIGTINENRPGSAALVLINPRETAVHVGELTVSAPDATNVSLTCPDGTELKVDGGNSGTARDCPRDIAPRSQEILPLRLQAVDTLAPGPRTMLVKVTANGSASESQSVVASTPLTVDVFAESDILKAVGVPVFLLLPGVIIVLTAWFLIKHVSPWRQVAGDVEIGDVVSAATATAILGLAVSLVVALVYPWLTETFIPGSERDYLKAYGFRDFYYVIGYSFAIAVLVWAIASGGFILARWLFVPWPYDKPEALLRKIGLRGIAGGGTRFTRVAIDPSGQGLELGGRAVNRALVAPRIVVAVKPASGDLSQRIEDHARAGHAFRLWRTVHNAIHDKQAAIDFKTGDLKDPQILERAKLTTKPGENPIVEVTPGA
jgi:hypothetical protein